MVQLWFSTGFVGWTETFDESSGKMIGRQEGSDGGLGACGRLGYTFGTTFECSEYSECARCPGVNAPPACEL